MIDGKPLLVVVGGSDTGRTPMVAGLVRAALGPEVIVRTGGVLAHAGEAAMPEAQMALEQLGVDIRQHRAQPLTSEQRRHADLLLTVDHGTALVLHSEFPNDGRIVCLAALCDQPDVLDPHRMPLGVWIATARQLQAMVGQALPIVRQRLGIADEPRQPVAIVRVVADDDTIDRMCRLLQTAETLPMIVDWNRVRHELVQNLRALAADADLHDLTPAAVLMIEGALTHYPTQPPAEVLQRLRQAIAQVRSPLDSAALVQIGRVLIEHDRQI